MALGVEKGHNVLDLCAAPGGKTVVLASMMFPKVATEFPGMYEKPEGRLVCNESSRSRLGRLNKVVTSFCRPALTAPGTHIFLTNVDAAGCSDGPSPPTIS